jgi:hypothetical protein
VLTGSAKIGPALPQPYPNPGLNSGPTPGAAPAPLGFSPKPAGVGWCNRTPGRWPSGSSRPTIGSTAGRRSTVGQATAPRWRPKASTPCSVIERRVACVPEPPAVAEIKGLALQWESWTTEALIHRIHRTYVLPERFNPGDGHGRFHPIVTRSAPTRPIPTLYGGSSLIVALCETLFRLEPANHRGPVPVPKKRVLQFAHAAHRPTRTLTLLTLQDDNLRALGVMRAQLLEPGPAHDARTAPWASTFHAACPDAHGLDLAIAPARRERMPRLLRRPGRRDGTGGRGVHALRAARQMADASRRGYASGLRCHGALTGGLRGETGIAPGDGVRRSGRRDKRAAMRCGSGPAGDEYRGRRDRRDRPS